MRTGILGGTFNPPHLGHLHAAELAHRALNLDRVLFIPTNIPPHKVLPENTASAEDRCEMVRRLTAEKTWAMLDTIEIDRGGASYTVDTLRALHARGETDLHLIVGTDMLCTLEHWYAEQGCNFCGWQLYERGELVDVLWGELEWSSPTDDDELPEVTGPAWIVDKVAHYGG